MPHSLVKDAALESLAETSRHLQYITHHYLNGNEPSKWYFKTELENITFRVVVPGFWRSFPKVLFQPLQIIWHSLHCQNVTSWPLPKYLAFWYFLKQVDSLFPQGGYIIKCLLRWMWFVYSGRRRGDNTASSRDIQAFPSESPSIGCGTIPALLSLLFPSFDSRAFDLFESFRRERAKGQSEPRSQEEIVGHESC